MRILYDHQIFTIQKYGGISRYFCELMDQFTLLTNIYFTLSLKYSYNENLLNRALSNQFWSNQNSIFSNLKSPFFQQDRHLNRLTQIIFTQLKINQHESIRQLRKQEFDIFHPTYYDPYFLKHIGEKPYVLTVYDMIHELYPEFFSVRDLTIQRKKQLIENATSVIAISHNTKNDIIHFTNVDPDRVSVVHLGNPLKPTDSYKHNEKKEGSLDLDLDYLLFVGNRSGYKNFTRMISSIASLVRDNTSLHLYCAGGGPFTPVEIQLLKDLNIFSKVHFINISTDDILIELYKNARAFIFPSLYEGFGLPILEAFSCGCPLLASNSSSFSEIAGDAACFFDPESGDSIAEAVESILSNPDYRTDLIKKGYRRLKCFSWEKTARETKCVYDNTLYQYV